MAKKTLHDLFVEELREIMDAEKQGVRAYPQLIKAASAQSLKDALSRHLEETKEQVERLNRIFEELDVRMRGKACETVRGLVDDARDMMEKDLSPQLIDVALIVAAQKIEHFEIASYGAACAHAEALGLEPVAELLETTLDEEKATDDKLNDLALNDINPKAVEMAEEIVEGEREAAADKPRRRKK